MTTSNSIRVKPKPAALRVSTRWFFGQPFRANPIPRQMILLIIVLRICLE